MHVVVCLPSAFYSAIASTVVETLQAVNDVHGSALFSFEFVAKHPRAVSKSGISFPAKMRPSKKMDVLILLAGLRPEISETLRLLDEESEHTKPLIRLAQRQERLSLQLVAPRIYWRHPACSMESVRPFHDG